MYLVLAVILLVSTAVIINYVYEGFRYTHGHGSVLAAPTPSQDYDDYEYVPAPIPTPTATTAPAQPTPEHTPEPTPEPTPTPVPRVERQEFLDWRTHYNNDEIIGQVWIPNTTIYYLVAQTTDNDFYLSHNLRGNRYLPGSIFLDYLADIRNPGDHNWVLYGHNMARNHKFHMVRRFLQEDFFFANRYIHFSTIYADYVFEVFSAYVAHIDHPYIDPWYYDWGHWINVFREMSRFDAGIEVSEHDRILTLSTCENSYRNLRIAVHAVLISETFPHLEGGGYYDYNSYD